MEKRLAELADVVILVVESPGTFAELGAFSLHPVLRKKLLPILDNQFEHDASFINTGPIRWIDADSQFRPSIWVPLKTVLDCAGELDRRLKQIPAQHERRARDLRSSLKHLLLLVTDIVTVFAPCRLEHVDHYLKTVLQGDAYVSTSMLMALARSVGLISSTADSHGESIYWSRVEHRQLRAADHKISLPYSTLRTQLVSAMQAIPAARTDLQLIARV